MERRFWVRIVLLLVVLGLPILSVYSNQDSNTPHTSITFLPVGQGDAILIETFDGYTMLIDGGPDSAVVSELGSALPWYERTIDVLVATHPDKDHIGGLTDVLRLYQVPTIFMTGNRGESPDDAAFVAAVAAELTTIIDPSGGEVYQLGASTTIRVFAPLTDPTPLESNTASIVLQIDTGDVEILLTGDAPASIEDYLVRTFGQEMLSSEILKLGHHGSKTSSSAKFLAAVRPTYTIVSAGADNRYGHPHAEVLDRVAAVGAIVRSTATNKPITFLTDGTSVWEE